MIFLYLWGAVIAAIVLHAIILRILGFHRKRLSTETSEEERLTQAWKEARSRATLCWVLALILAFVMAVTWKMNVGQDWLWPLTLVSMIIAGLLTTYADYKCAAAAEPTSKRADAAMERSRKIGEAVGEKTWRWILRVGDRPYGFFLFSLFCVWTIDPILGIATTCAIGLTSVWTARVRNFKGCTES